jgi:hypothetical protein
MALPENTLQSQRSTANDFVMAQVFRVIKLATPRLLQDFGRFPASPVSLTPFGGLPCWNSATKHGVSFPTAAASRCERGVAA